MGEKSLYLVFEENPFWMCALYEAIIQDKTDKEVWIMTNLLLKPLLRQQGWFRSKGRRNKLTKIATTFRNLAWKFVPSSRPSIVLFNALKEKSIAVKYFARPSKEIKSSSLDYPILQNVNLERTVAAALSEDFGTDYQDFAIHQNFLI